MNDQDIAIEFEAKYAAEVKLYCWSFADEPAVKFDGVTLSSPAITATPTGLTIGTPSVLAAVFYNNDGSTVPIGQGVVALVSGGTAGQDYLLACAVTTSDGQTPVMKGKLGVR